MTHPTRAALEPVAWVSHASLEVLTGYLMKRAFNVIHADLVVTLEAFGLRTITFSALVMVVDNPGITQTQLAQGLCIERSNLVVVVDELETNDLIARNPMPSDRRAYALTATPAGQLLRDRVLAAVHRHEAQVLAILTPEEQAVLNRLLRRIEGA